MSRLRPLADMAFHVWNPMRLTARLLLISSSDSNWLYGQSASPNPTFAQSHSPYGKPWWERRVNMNGIKVRRESSPKLWTLEGKKKQACMCVYLCTQIYDCLFCLDLLKSYLYAISLVSRDIIPSKSDFLNVFQQTPISLEQVVLWEERKTVRETLI